MSTDIKSIKRKMLIKYPFFGSIVANVNYEKSDVVPTAATDGKKIYYNESFLDSLSSDEQIFIFAHEICHIAFNHILRSDGKDPYLWNLSTDAVINAFLKKDGLKVIEGGVEIENAINYDAEELYEKMLKEQEKKKTSQNAQENVSKQQSRSGSGEMRNKQQDKNDSIEDSYSELENENNNFSDSNDNDNALNKKDNKESSDFDSKKNDVGHDTHSMWEDAIKEQKEKQSNKKDDLLDKMFNNSDNENDYESEMEKQQKENIELGERDAFQKNAEEKKKELNKLKRSLTQESISVGKLTNSIKREVSDIGNAKKLLDWRYLLKEAVKYDVDWSYKNATIEDGVITPNLEELPMPETEILLDTSGSISEKLLKNFLRECKNILKYSKLKVGCVDSQFYGFTEIRNEEDIDKMEFIGGGGNDFEVVVQSFSKRVENKIFFTDGYAMMPNTPLDVIWVVFGEDKINPKGGKVIYIDQAELNKLYSYEYDESEKVR